jgi:hypothetical protein
MKKEHTTFITSLLTNPKLTKNQRDRVVELALRDLSKNGSEERILKDLELIKENLGIKVQVPKDNGHKRKNSPWLELISKTQNNFPSVGETLTEEDFKEYFSDEEFIEWKKKWRSEDPDTLIDEEIKLNGDDVDKESAQVELKSSPNTVLPKYINPKNLASFLIDYNQHPILKYTCHEIDDEDIIENINEKCGTDYYDLAKHQELIINTFNKFRKSYYVNYKIINLILVYLNGTTYKGKTSTWSSENINFNWKSSDLIDWGKNNPGKVPNPGENLILKIRNKGYKLKKVIPSEISGERITSFSGLVNHFKHLFHIKGDNPLKAYIKRINDLEGWSENILFNIDHEDFWENLELFTDVDKLLQSYRVIIRIILETVTKFQLETPKVKLAFKEINNNIILSIHHQNSVYKKTLSNTLNRLGDAQSSLINNQINGLCDLYLKADFDHNQYALVNLWNGKSRNKTILKEFEGVEYILTFRK